MLEDLLPYDSPWKPFLAHMLAMLPILIVQLVGLVIALIMLGSRRKPAVLVIIALVISMVLSLAGPIIHRNLWESAMLGDGDPRALERLMVIVGYAFTTGHALTWLLLIIAAFGWRRARFNRRRTL